MSSTVRSIFCGGQGNNYAVRNIMDYITIASAGNATDFGDLTVARTRGEVVNNTTRGILGGGSQTGADVTIDYVTIGTTGNATDFGDLVTNNYERRCAYHSATVGYFNSGTEQITMATAANATATGFTMGPTTGTDSAMMPGWIAANG